MIQFTQKSAKFKIKVNAKPIVSQWPHYFCHQNFRRLLAQSSTKKEKVLQKKKKTHTQKSWWYHFHSLGAEATTESDD